MKLLKLKINDRVWDQVCHSSFVEFKKQLCDQSWNMVSIEVYEMVFGVILEQIYFPIYGDMRHKNRNSTKSVNQFTK